MSSTRQNEDKNKEIKECYDQLSHYQFFTREKCRSIARTMLKHGTEKDPRYRECETLALQIIKQMEKCIELQCSTPKLK